MKYVITGATSFIGIELTKFLLKQGDEVFAVCRPDSKNAQSIPSEATIVTAEMADYSGLYHDIPQADVFINLAWAGTGHDGRNVTDVQQGNVINSIGALWGAYKMDCKVFVEAGSQAEYGSTSEQQTEEMHCNPFSEYGKAKLRVKHECFRLVEQMRGMKYIHLRIFSTFGENDHPWTLVMSALDKMLANETVDLSPCTQNWNFIYSSDLVQIVVGLCQNAIKNPEFKHEVYNIASDDSRELKAFVTRMKELSLSQSQLNFGAVTPQNFVSLQPCITKTTTASGVTKFTPFDEVIKKIIEKKSTKQ